MGLGEWLSEKWSNLCDSATKVVKNTWNTVSSIAKDIKDTAIELCKPIVSVVSTAVTAVAKIAGIFSGNANVEQIGEASFKAEKKPEDFDNINAYISYLQKEIDNGKIELDKNPSLITRIANTAQGTSIAIKGFDEKFNVTTHVPFWITMGARYISEKLSGNEIINIVQEGAKNKATMSDIANYIEGKNLKGELSKSEISNIIENGLKISNPDWNQAKINSRFNDLLKKPNVDTDKHFEEHFDIKDK